MKIFLILLTIVLPTWFNNIIIPDNQGIEILEIIEPPTSDQIAEEQMQEVVDKWIQVFSDPSNTSIVDQLYRDDFMSDNELFRNFREVNRGRESFKKSGYKTALQSYFDDFQIKNVKLDESTLKMDEEAKTATFSVEIRVKSKLRRNIMANSQGFNGMRGVKELMTGRNYRVSANVRLECNSPIIFREFVRIGPIEDDDH